MSTLKRIAVDAMGGDGGAQLTVPAAVRALELTPDLTIILIGDEDQVSPLLSNINKKLSSRLRVVHTSCRIADDDKPTNVLRNGKDSSMYRAVDLVNQGEAEAMVSAGNTGALLMIGRHLLKTIPGIDKPAIVATIPGAREQGFLLDVGANPECSAQQLFQFAVMGSVLAESINARQASVGLLNIGAEHYKGTDAVRDAAALMSGCEALDYQGFVEANELYEGKADVVVCDGFVGNVTIKSSAGVANVVKKLIAEELAASDFREAGLPPGMLSRLTAQINPQRFNGASLLGLQGSIVKSHGNATSEGFTYAILQAVREVENAVPQLIADRVAAIIEAH